MLLHIYTNLLRLGLPFILFRLLIKGIKEPAYTKRWKERLGWTAYPKLIPKKSIWIHAVSVGEVQASLPIIQSLLQRYPETPLVLTTTTPTGAKHAWSLYKDSIKHTYLPYDLPSLVKRFLQRTNPFLTLFMETEIWPNIFHLCASSDIPIILANARLSPSSFKGYRYVTRFMAQALDKCRILTQSIPDQERFLKLGIKPENIEVIGNIKFDTGLPLEQIQEGKVLRDTIGRDRPVWISASTHAGEEESILQAQSLLREHLPDCLLILVPRHPDRFSNVEKLAVEKGFSVQRHSQGELIRPGTAVYIGDCIGRMFFFYAASDLAFVGGSLMPTGGHNLLEPASIGLPIISGPHLFNFQEISRLLLEKESLRIVSNSEEFAESLYNLFQHPEQSRAMGEKARKVVAENTGAVEKILQTIEPLVVKGRLLS